MALLIKADVLKELISIPQAVAAVRDGFRDQGEKPAYSAPRIRIQHEDRRVNVRGNVPVLFGAWLSAGQHITSIVASNKGVLQQGSVSKPRAVFIGLGRPGRYAGIIYRR